MQSKVDAGSDPLSCLQDVDAVRVEDEAGFFAGFVGFLADGVVVGDLDEDAADLDLVELVGAHEGGEDDVAF